MSCTSKRDRLEADLAFYEEALGKARTAYNEAISDNIASFELDTNEGDQRLVQRRIDRLSDEMDKLEDKIESTCNRLSGLGIVHVRLRRK